jgi:hypothetical protein
MYAAKTRAGAFAHGWAFGTICGLQLCLAIAAGIGACTTKEEKMTDAATKEEITDKKGLWAGDVVPASSNFAVSAASTVTLARGGDILLSMAPGGPILVRGKPATDAEIVAALREWMTAMRATTVNAP